MAVDCKLICWALRDKMTQPDMLICRELEVQVDKLKAENAKLRAQLNEKNKPWWKRWI